MHPWFGVLLAVELNRKKIGGWSSFAMQRCIACCGV